MSFQLDLVALRDPVRPHRRYFRLEAGTAAIYSTAMHPHQDVEPSPAFLHVGFKAAHAADVRALLERMEADGVTIAERNDEQAYVAFKCLDPDGHRIEVYWEPPHSQ